MTCKDCENGNPITPVYSDAKYILNPNCAETCNPSIYVPPEGGSDRTTELIAGDDILIEDFSDASVDRFRISYDPFVALTASLSIQGLVAGIIQSEPILKGKIVDEIRSSWSYNKGIIASQELNSIPVLPVTERALIETGLNVIDDITYTLDVDDGQGQGGSIAQATDSLLFGNEQIWGDHANMLGQPASSVSAMIAALANKQAEIKRNRLNSVFATGGINQRFFIIYPVSWGEGIFTKGVFEGGFQRLKNDAGTLVVTLAGSELPISWVNGEGHTEDIYIYQSLYDDRADAVEPIVIT